MSLFDHRIKDIQELLYKKEISASDLVEESLSQIGKVEGNIDAFLTLTEDDARDKAKQLDDLLAKNELNGKLAGIPAGIKDNILTKNVKTTCASKHLENFIPVYDATVMNKLNAENAITIGKLNMDEFAMGSSNENSAFKTTKNPWDTSYVPGGSSGGSAAAVAAGQVFFSLGSDTGGSIREPASFCGVVGMKPTYGRVSRYGLATFASSFDQISPITRTVEDNAYVLQAISGYDPLDSTSANRPVEDFTAALTGDIKGLKIAVPKEFMGQGVDENIKAEVNRALKVLEDLGAQWEEVSLPHADYATAAYYILSSTEASAALSRFDGIGYGERVEGEKLIDLYTKSRSEGFGAEVKRRIMFGTLASSTGYYEAYFKKAQKVRTLIKKDFEDVFEKYDVILGPTTPTQAFKLGEKKDPLTMYANDILTTPVNLAGVPAMSIPTGLVNGLPVGLQIIGKLFDESTVYRVAHAFESANNFTEKPKL